MKKTADFFSFLILVLPFVKALAGGGFDYITIKGPGITGEIDVTNPDLTGDFFAFADFSSGEIAEPVDPGQGYEIVRVYVEGSKDKPFDQLHYYPYTGFVFYDGLVNGSSEYDGKWYPANPSVEAPFRKVLAERARFTWIPFVILLTLLAIFYLAYRKNPQKS
ncbi:MAG: hypothetical protein FJZ87_00810 [Chloroflexi bacterium]|nr:hypothetical protein [Chloroflexota bacterium]